MKNPVTRHFNQDARLLGFAVAYGGTALVAVLVAFSDFSDGYKEMLALAFAPFLAGPGVLLLLAQLIRPYWGKDGPAESKTCQICGKRAATTEIRALKVTGLVIVMTLSQIALRACRQCGVQAYLKGATHSLALGWWGVISFFVTPGFVVHDLFMILRVLMTTRAPSIGRLLEDERDYAERLLATKDIDVVVEVLVDRTGLDADGIRSYLLTLAPPSGHD